MSDPNDWTYYGFCELLSNIKLLRERLKATPKSYLPALREKIYHKSAHASRAAGRNLLPYLRLLMPELDKERKYGIKESKMASLVVRELGVSERSATGLKLAGWKQTMSGSGGRALAGDLPGIVRDVLSTEERASTLSVVIRAREQGHEKPLEAHGSWTLADINSWLARVATVRSDASKVNLDDGEAAAAKASEAAASGGGSGGGRGGFRGYCRR